MTKDEAERAGKIIAEYNRVEKICLDSHLAWKVAKDLSAARVGTDAVELLRTMVGRKQWQMHK